MLECGSGGSFDINHVMSSRLSQFVKDYQSHTPKERTLCSGVVFNSLWPMFEPTRQASVASISTINLTLVSP